MINPHFWINLFVDGAIVSAISFFVVSYLMPKTIKSLSSKGDTVQDVHKPNRQYIPRPAGPTLLVGIAVAEIILYFLTLNTIVIAVLFTTIIAFVIGFIDDKRVMPGWFKPLALIASAAPIIFFSAHGSHLNLIFGDAFIPLLYIPLVLVIIPIAGNTINSIDVLNGVASGFVVITMVPLLFSVAIFGRSEVFLSALPLFFGTIALYRYHKFPSKIFPGDSGTLLIGAMYGSIAIAGNSELIAVIALLPAVMNSFLFLASVKKIVEHRKVKSRPTLLMDDFRLMASNDKNAPITLLRLILAEGPLSERDICREIFKLAVFSSFLALISIVIQYYFLSGILPK